MAREKIVNVPAWVPGRLRQEVAAAVGRMGGKTEAEKEELRRQLDEEGWRGLFPDATRDSDGVLRSRELARERYPHFVDLTLNGEELRQERGNGKGRDEEKKDGRRGRNRSGGWPGKPNSNAEWDQYALEKLEIAGTRVEFQRGIGEYGNRGWGIKEHLAGNGMTRYYMCGCIEEVDVVGNSSVSSCGRDDCDLS